MRIERQGKDECMLTTIAALASRPLAEVRGRACSIAGVAQWTTACASVGQYWGTLEALIKEWNLTGIPTLAEWHASQMKAPVPTSNISLPATGRGSIGFTTRKGATHICPFEDGLIYDSSRPERGYTLDEFCITHDLTVRGIFPEHDAAAAVVEKAAAQKRLRERDRVRAWRAAKKAQ